jgi:hypothetical protein
LSGCIATCAFHVPEIKKKISCCICGSIKENNIIITVSFS